MPHGSARHVVGLLTKVNPRIFYTKCRCIFSCGTKYSHWSWLYRIFNQRLISTQSNQTPPSIEMDCPRSSISSDKMWKRKVYQWYKETYRKQERKPSGQFPLVVRADPTLTIVSSRKASVKSNFLDWNQFEPILWRRQVQFLSIVQYEYPYL